MKKLNRNQWIAVAVSLALVAFLLYGGTLLGLFTSQNNTNQDQSDMAQNLPTTGVQTQDVTIGQGPAAEAGDTITGNYVGTLTDGKVFDSSVDRNQPFTFTLGAGQVIRGWDEGIVGMRVGGERKLIIAPDYGYGDQGIGPIPPNSVLIFDVQLLSVNSASATSTAQ